MDAIPYQAWMVLSVAVAAVLLLVGLAIKKKIDNSKKVDIHVGKDGVDLELCRSVTDVVKPPEKAPTPNNPIKAMSDSAERFTDLGK